jgi:hypothetical protein
MNTSERGELLRKRFRALGGLPLPKMEKRPPTNDPVKPKGYQLRPFPVLLQKHRVRWVSEADLRPAVTVATKRRQGPSSLTVLAKQKPVKLLKDASKLAAYRL